MKSTNPTKMLVVLLLGASWTAFAQGQPRTAVSEHEIETLPENPQVGECYMRAKLAPIYKMYQEEVMVSPATERWEVVPGEYKGGEKKVLVEPEKTEFKVIPAKYETKVRKVLVAPERTEQIVHPAKFRTVTERVLVRPEGKVWKRGEGLFSELSNTSGDPFCLVTVPAEYKEVKRQVLVKDAWVETKKIPAVYDEYEETILVKKAEVKKLTTPPEYKTLGIETTVKKTDRKKVAVEAQYQMVDRKEMSKPERIGWVRVLCKTNLTDAKVREIQTALNKTVHTCGEVTGVMNEPTRLAIKGYTGKHNLLTGLTYDFLDHIGVATP